MLAPDDSMEPTISNKTLILLDRSRTKPRDSRLFVVYSQESLTIKRFSTDGVSWGMCGDNSAYPDREYMENDILVGEVAWFPPRKAPVVTMPENRTQSDELPGGRAGKAL